MKLQNTDTANKLNTAIQMKNAAPRPGTSWLKAQKKNSRQAMNTRYTAGRKIRRGKRDTSAPYTGCSRTMEMKVPVNSICRV